jgi:hypothetical protein
MRTKDCPRVATKDPADEAEPLPPDLSLRFYNQVTRSAGRM